MLRSSSHGECRLHPVEWRFREGIITGVPLRTGSPPREEAQDRRPEKVPDRARVAWLEPAAVILLFAALTVAWTWPLAATIGRVLPSDLGDPLLNTWILGWITDRASHGFGGLWNAPIFFPYPNTLAYSEHLLGFLPITLPVHWLTRNPVAAYDVAFLISVRARGRRDVRAGPIRVRPA